MCNNSLQVGDGNAKTIRIDFNNETASTEKEHFSKHNLMWLVRNIGVKNSNHKNYETAVEEIKRRLKDKHYDD